MLTLTEKEKLLLKDEKAHEELCVKKYSKYSNEAEDPELQTLFGSILQHEQQHLNSINSMLNGQVPSMNQQGQQASSPTPPSTATSTFSQKDCDMCQDTLSTEKFISSTYNTSIFEFTDHNAREMLNHIQKEEQEHGEQIYNYMAMKGYYNS